MQAASGGHARPWAGHWRATGRLPSKILVVPTQRLVKTAEKPRLPSLSGETCLIGPPVGARRS
eukprot:243344-Pyramimonas_sp.AAC.1